jgi:hypothetical protein
MRQGIWAIVACALACAPSAAAQTPPAPAQDAPVVVAGTHVTMAQARARAGTEAGTYEVRATLTDLVQARFIAGEAALRGIGATPRTWSAPRPPSSTAGAARPPGAHR